jgi:hypothetical protein
VDDALRWLDRAEEARMVAEQLIDPGAKEAVLQVTSGWHELPQPEPRRRSLPSQLVSIRVADL